MTAAWPKPLGCRELNGHNTRAASAIANSTPFAMQRIWRITFIIAQPFP
jgi:hypothetical protein